ncbi:Hypothetical predicted protein [Xyrichtys novacula]|uniref:Uncharacterized protein n=1 Tax=Xyrichtys novacula TaxID=13765 RepID=A0AAV1ER49_XYRNO|nr:Hypothetical predicted protein [Xyrichtys novacula]
MGKARDHRMITAVDHRRDYGSSDHSIRAQPPQCCFNLRDHSQREKQAEQLHHQQLAGIYHHRVAQVEEDSNFICNCIFSYNPSRPSHPAGLQVGQMDVLSGRHTGQLILNQSVEGLRFS